MNDKIKATLTIRQSLNLQKLGINIRRASWYEAAGSTAQNGCGGQTVTNFPVFTIADLLSILPKEITYLSRRSLTITSTDKLYFAFYASWEKVYEYSTEDTVTHHDGDEIFSAPELIDALYQLLIWAIEHNYVNTKDEKK